MNRWRVGRKVGRTVYVQAGDEPSDEDTLVGLMDTAELAELVVESVNAAGSVRRGFAAMEQAVAEEGRGQ